MSSIASLVLYLTSFSLAASFLWYGVRSNYKVMIGLGLLIPILIGSYRYGIGTDYFTYVRIYNDLSHFSFQSYLDGTEYNTELGFYFIIKLSASIFGGPSGLFAISSFITIVSFYLGLRRYKTQQVALIYFLYLLIIFPLTFNAVRQGIAISLCFYAFSFIMQHKSVKYVIWIVIASLFHVSALLLLPFYFVNRIIRLYRRNTDLQIVFRYITLAVVVLSMIPILFQLVLDISIFDKYAMYQTSKGYGSFYDLFVKLLPLIFVLPLLRRMILKDQLATHFLVAMLVFDIIFSTIGTYSTFVARIALYFSCFSLLLLANATAIFDSNSGRRIVTSAVVLYGVAVFFVTYFYFKQSEVIPYAIGGII